MKASPILSAIVIALLQSLACADTKSSSNSSEQGIWYRYYGEPLTIDSPSGQIVFEVQGRVKGHVDLVDVLINGQVWKSYKMRFSGTRELNRTLHGDWEGHKIYVRCKVEFPPDSYDLRTITSCYFRLDGKNAGEIIPSIALKSPDVN